MQSAEHDLEQKKKINMAIYFIASSCDTIIFILVSAICVFDKTCRYCEQIPVTVRLTRVITSLFLVVYIYPPQIEKY